MRSILLALALAAPPTASHPLHETPPCQVSTFEGDSFISCAFDPAKHAIRLERRAADGKPGSLPELRTALGPDADAVLFAMNAGMYDPARRPVGLYVANGREEQPLTLRNGRGNFFLKPNGIFWIDRAGAPHIDESDAYQRRGARPIWATQSGPLLLHDGALHPAIMPNGSSLHIRNAVGTRDGKAVFVISATPVSFGRLARFLRDALGCTSALYLDGSVSSLWAPALGRIDRRGDLGTFVIVSRARPH